MPSQPVCALTVNALRRRLKRHVLKEAHEFFAVCQPGFERFLLTELQALPGAQSIRGTQGGAEFCGPLELMYLANLHLRTAVRVLIRIASFRATSLPELHNRARRVRWERWIGFAEGVRYDISAGHSRLMHHRHIGHAVHEALLRTMGQWGQAISVDADSPLRVCVRLHEDVCTISVDSSGALLHKRGYRVSPVASPLRETTAAALLAASDFSAHRSIVDPFCGSATFLIEAARALRGIAPGAGRAFAFESLPCYNPAVYKRLREQAAAGARGDTGCRLCGFDRSASALEASRANARAAGVDGDIEFAPADAVRLNGDGGLGAGGLLIGNLPYGKRAGDTKLPGRLYPALGEQLRRCCRGWHFGLLMRRGTEALLRLDAAESIRFVNGGIPVVYLMGRIT